jgi:hypothetical protein
VVGPKDLFFASGIVSGGVRVLDEATPAIVAAIALLALGGISVSYDVSGGAMAAVSGSCIHALYDSSTTVVEPLPEDQARLRVRLQERLDLLEEQAGSQLLTFEVVAVDSVVAEALEMIGHVGQGVVYLAAQQILAVVQLREAHNFRVAVYISA